MEQNRRKWLWWLAVALWTAVVLGFSSERFSNESTSSVLAPLVQWLFPMLSAEAREFLQSWLPRTAAHVFEYAVLAALAYRALRESSSAWRSAGFALALVIAVAIADETHQAFSATRNGRATDVLLDAASGGAALLLLIGVPRFGPTRPLRRKDTG